MKHLLSMLAAVLIMLPVTVAHAAEGVMTSGAAVEEEVPVQKSDAVLRAVVFFSDNCAICKVVEPRFQKALEAVNADKVETIKLDFTSDETVEATKVMAHSKDLDGLIRKFGVKTGFVSLINKDGDIIGKITKKDDESEIAAKLAEAIVKASKS